MKILAILCIFHVPLDNTLCLIGFLFFITDFLISKLMPFFYFLLAIDIQSILNGAAKFCKHCDVVIDKEREKVIKKKGSELSFLNKDSELLGDGDDLYFCDTTCYVQFALMNRSPSLTQDKVRSKTITQLLKKIGLLWEF